MTGTVWDEARTERLRKMQADKLTTCEIAIAMGISRNAAIGKLYRMGLQPAGQLANRGNGGRVIVRKLKPAKPQPDPQPPADPLDLKGPTPSQRARWGVGGGNRHVMQPTPAIPFVDKFQAPTASAVRFFAMQSHHCKFPLNAAVPIARHLVCGRPRVKSGLPGDPYCRSCSDIAINQSRRKTA